MTLTTIACDLCGSTEFRPLHPASRIHGYELKDHFSSSRKHAGHLSIVRCVHCNLVMTNPRDDNASLMQIYTDLHDELYELEEKNRKQTALERMDLITNYLSVPSKLLDIGCSTGIFLKEAESRGWDTTGLDPSSWAIERAKGRCLNTQFVCKALEEANFQPDYFNVVTMWDVIEHLTRPSNALNRIRDWLAPGGWLFLNFPNIDSLSSKLFGRHWVLFLREHLWYFSPETITALLNKNGFAVVNNRPNYVRFSLAFILTRLSQGHFPLSNSIKNLANIKLLMHMPIRFPIGELTLEARKLPI